MEKLTKTVVDCSTGIQEVIELTDEEIAQLEVDRANAEADRAAREAEAEAKAAVKRQKRLQHCNDLTWKEVVND